MSVIAHEGECDQCGEEPEEGDQLIRCIGCDENCCTTTCIAGRGVECFQCEQRSADRDEEAKHLENLDELDPEDLIDEGGDPWGDDDESCDD